MNVNLIRVDERLIHGQIMSSWVKKCWIRRIILIDEEYVNDEFMKMVLPMSAPSGTKVEIRGVSEAISMLSEDHSEENALLLFKELKYVYDFYRQGFHFSELNIGNIGSAADRKPITKKVYMSEEEKKMCRNMANAGIYIYIQELPHDSAVDVMAKI